MGGLREASDPGFSASPGKPDEPPWPMGLWAIELKQDYPRALRGTSEEVVEAIRNWTTRAVTEDERRARKAFGEGFLQGMQWCGVFKPQAEVPK